MKKIVFLLMFPLLLGAQEAAKEKVKNKWITSYDLALTRATQDKKNVIVYFTGSDWCMPCIALKRDFFDTPAFDQYAEAYILLYIDIPRNSDLIAADVLKQNKELASKLNKKGAVPMLKIINEDGNELDAITGYSMNADIKYHTKFLDKYIK
tara:strand:- start:10617 stop:11072 length:456 start_codon:yes stop_codon:yes gene_type:complete